MKRGIAIIAGGVIVASTQAQVLYGTAGSVYNQEFNSLTSSATATVVRPTSSTATASVVGQAWTNNSTLQGWVASFENPANVGSTTPSGDANWVGAGVVNSPTPHTVPDFNVRFLRTNNGALATGSMYNYGAANDADRALGMLNSGGTTTGLRNSMGLILRNTTGTTLDSFTLSYIGEQWRIGTGDANIDRLDFSYRLYSAGTFSINDLRPNITAGWTNVNSLDFSSPINTGTNVALDGNLAANRVNIADTVALNWAPGEDLVLRWADIDATGSDDGLAIDGLNFSATAPVPEPGTLAALGFGALALLRRRKRA